MPRESVFGRLVRLFHEHPRGRLIEFAFWAGIGLALGATAWLAWRAGRMSTPIAIMLGIVALCLFLWAFLPRARTRAPPPLPKGKRGEIAQAVRKMKAEKKRKKAPPGQHPPIRRG